MSADTADQHRRLANLVERVDGEGVVIDDVETDIAYDGELRATISLEIDEVPAPLVDAAEEASASEVADTLSDAGGAAAAKTDDAVSSETADQEDVDVPAESDVAPADLESEEDNENRQQASTSSPCNGDESDDSNDQDEADEDSLTEEIVSILQAEGEMRSSDLRDRVDGNRTEFYDACDELKEGDRLSVRDDPDDGRRKLYSLADHEPEADGPVWNGRDPEAVVADSSLPARVVLDDILDAVAAADTLIEAAETLDVDVDNLEPVCWDLTLKRPESYEVVDDVGEQVAKIREVAA